MNWLLVFLGGGFGSLCRYGIVVFFPANDLEQGHFPWATLTANILACLVLGGGMALAARNNMPKEYSLLLLTGFCGGFSTFSTFSAELLRLFEAGYYLIGAAYIGLSLLAGILTILLALSLLK